MNNSKLHVPTALISLLAAGLIGLGVYMATINVTAATVKRHDEKIERTEKELSIQDVRIARLETSLGYIKGKVDNIDSKQATMLDKINKLLRRGENE